MYRRLVKPKCVLLSIHCHGMRLHCVFTVNSSVNVAAEVPRKRHITAVTMNTRPRMVFSCPLKPEF